MREISHLITYLVIPALIGFAISKVVESRRRYRATHNTRRTHAERTDAMRIRVDDVFRLAAYNGGYRVWKVNGIHLGATHQESVISLVCLDRFAPLETGEIFVPVEILDAANLERM